MSSDVTLDVCLKPEQQNDKRFRCKGLGSFFFQYSPSLPTSHFVGSWRNSKENDWTESNERPVLDLTGSIASIRAGKGVH